MPRWPKNIRQGRQPGAGILSGQSEVPLSSLEETVDPTATDDASKGFDVGSHWVNTTSDEAFELMDATPGAAVWKGTTVIGPPTGPASGDLSGTYPGPTVATVGGTAAATIGAHPARVDNPHAVTAAQAGAYTKSEVDVLIDVTLKPPEAFAPSGTYPVTFGGNAVQQGDTFRITSAGSMGAVTVNVEDLLIALIDTPGQTDANWMVAESNRDQATETVKGVAEIATQAETDAGTDDARFITPLKFGASAQLAAAIRVVTESFAATNARFFGELGLPASQGWIDTATGSATIDLVDESVFGVTKQVVRHNDDVTNGSTTSRLDLTAQNWTDIDAFGASYSGTSRLDTVNGALGFFSGLQANAAENPLASGNRRYGINFKDNGGNLQVSDADAGGSTVIFDGTGGNPQIDFDEYVSWECVVPAGLGAAEFYVNGVLSTFAPLFLVNGGGLGTHVIVSSGSTGGVNRVSYHSDFGVTIYEEASTKTLAAATMAADVAQVLIPEGKRDYTVILPDGNPRPVGARLEVVANNLLGQLILVTQNQSVPEALFNGLRELTLDIAFKEVVSGVNTVANANVYIGFGVSEFVIFAQLSSSVDQIPTTTNPTVITFNTQDDIQGITHSVSVNPGEIEIERTDLYAVVAQPQVGKTSGGAALNFDMFVQVDRGAGFVDKPNSNVKITIKDAERTDVIVHGFTIQLNKGDKMRLMQKVSVTGNGLGMLATAAVVGPPTVPVTPSIIFAMFRVRES